MDFEQFNRLATGDPMTLHMALELLLQNGRRTIRAVETPQLMDACTADMGGLFTAGKIQEIVDACKMLAGLETGKLVSYIKRSGLDVKDPDADEEGICPLCGAELEYENDIRTDDGGFFEWKCPNCGATGKEGYDKVFDRHYDVVAGQKS